jgi:hypothetical protein
MAAMQIQLDLVSSRLQEQGGLIGNVYTDSAIPAGFFADDIHKFCLAARLYSASDKDKVRVKVQEKYWGGQPAPRQFRYVSSL